MSIGSLRAYGTEHGMRDIFLVTLLTNKERLACGLNEYEISVTYAKSPQNRGLFVVYIVQKIS